MESITMTSILASVTEFITAAMGWMGDVAEFVVSNPLVLMFIIIPVVGLGIGLFRRILSL